MGDLSQQGVKKMIIFIRSLLSSHNKKIRERLELAKKRALEVSDYKAVSIFDDIITSIFNEETK